ncbi:MAG: pseudouridine-5'-phosphate glycosidase [Proteobacteria bacterium]|nr:pseudouridine-5'-phosphate glycosidase [Pseudomonadota bacterium]
MEAHLDIRPEIAEAQAEGRAVVALETTLIAHGLPHPANIETALALEAIVRREGAVPAFIGLLDGRIRIGLTEDELARFAEGEEEVRKVSRRDLAWCLATGETGATTVAGTMICAALAGIRVFAAGGIGGVHPGWQQVFDVSADLEELGRFPVAVVCAGAKSILDLANTLEWLETRGVPVVGYGTDEFPAFYCRESGLDLMFRVDSPEEAARLMAAQWSLGLQGGLVLANPIPAEAALDREEMTTWVGQATADAARDGVGGKDLTPYLLARIAALSGGRSMAANIALLHHNAALAARVAMAYAGLG